MARDFWELYMRQQEAKKCVCVGLDSDSKKIPNLTNSHDVLTFNRRLIFELQDLMGFCKPNLAFYEAQGSQGLDDLRSTIAYSHQVSPHVPVIVDGKRADIGNTNDGYASFLFDWLGADAITVNPYLGEEALRPFLKRKDKGIFPLIRTSNPGAGELQDLQVLVPPPPGMSGSLVSPTTLDGYASAGYGIEPLYEVLARKVATSWNQLGNCGGVVGATCPEELKRVREIMGDMALLIPGIGAQGGEVLPTILAGRGKALPHVIINSSRAIIFASAGDDFAQAARVETIKLHDAIVKALILAA